MTEMIMLPQIAKVKKPARKQCRLQCPKHEYDVIVSLIAERNLTMPKLNHSQRQNDIGGDRHDDQAT